MKILTPRVNILSALSLKAIVVVNGRMYRNGGAYVKDEETGLKALADLIGPMAEQARGRGRTRHFIIDREDNTVTFELATTSRITGAAVDLVVRGDTPYRQLNDVFIIDEYLDKFKSTARFISSHRTPQANSLASSISELETRGLKTYIFDGHIVQLDSEHTEVDVRRVKRIDIGVGGTPMFALSVRPDNQPMTGEAFTHVVANWDGFVWQAGTGILASSEEAALVLWGALSRRNTGTETIANRYKRELADEKANQLQKSLDELRKSLEDHGYPEDVIDSMIAGSRKAWGMQEPGKG